MASWLRLAGALVGLYLTATACFTVRKRFIATWFRDAPAGVAPGLPPGDGVRPAPALAGAAVPAPSSPPRLRVLLIDGLGNEHARAMPAFSQQCTTGVDVTVDVGFPTVSLPVQAVLWTGLTQAQLGLLYRIKALDVPPVDALPARVGDSVAVAEDHSFIAGSFGFATLLPGREIPPGWKEGAFAVAAGSAVASAASLVFVHVLRVDKAGHKAGAGSDDYRAAVRWSDDLIRQLQRDAPPAADVRWVILSDHGHRAAGGHGGHEPHIRLVRACLVGGGAAPLSPPVSGRAPAVVHLVDLARSLSDFVNLPPPARAVGRPLDVAIRHPAAGATLSPWQWRARWPRLLAGWLLGLAALGALVGWLWRRGTSTFLDQRRWLMGAAIVGWLPLALAALTATRGWPSLSNPVVYPPLGRDISIGAAPGLLWLLVVFAATLLITRPGVPRGSVFIDAVALALVPGAALALGLLVACGGIEAIASVNAPPPVTPHATALASVALALEAAATVIVAVAMGLSCLIDRARTRGTRRRPVSANADRSTATVQTP